MKKKCELCGGVARMYCESDQASLCWDCDHKVHGANFLVAKHTRCLLCSACQSPTPWKASGPRLGPTVSACDSCVSLRSGGGGGISTSGHNLSENRSRETSGHDYDEHLLGDDDGGAESYDDDEEDDEDEEYSDDDDDYDDDDDDDDDDNEEEGENQVVPWAAAAAELQPPMVSSSSSVSSGGGGEAFSRNNVGSLGTKRTRGNSDLLYSDEEIGCSSKRSSREPAPRSTATINSIMRLHSEKSTDGDDLVYARRDHNSR